MSNRVEVGELVRELHAARLRGDLEGLCRLFADDGAFRIVGASDGKPISISARGLDEFRPWLSMLVKTFRLRDYELLSLTTEDGRFAAHWRVSIHSRITGKELPTELVDLAELEGGRIKRYTEFFVPR